MFKLLASTAVAIVLLSAPVMAEEFAVLPSRAVW